MSTIVQSMTHTTALSVFGHAGGIFYFHFPLLGKVSFLYDNFPREMIRNPFFSECPREGRNLFLPGKKLRNKIIKALKEVKRARYKIMVILAHVLD